MANYSELIGGQLILCNVGEHRPIYIMTRLPVARQQPLSK
jgi:hypothetical protein